DDDVAVVGRERVDAAAAERSAEIEAAVHRADLHRPGVDAFEHHVALDRLGRDLARGVEDLDVVVDRAGLDAPARAGHLDAALDRLDHDELAAADHPDVAVDAARLDLALDALDRDVGGHSGQLERHPYRNGDLVVDAGGNAVSGLGVDLEAPLFASHRHVGTPGMIGHDAHRVLPPRPDLDVAGEAVELESRAGLHGHGGVGGPDSDHHSEDERCEVQHGRVV